jgi:hypothetical protein
MPIKIEPRKQTETEQGNQPQRGDLDVSLSTGNSISEGTESQDAIRGSHVEKEALGALRQQKSASLRQQGVDEARLEEIRALEGTEKVEDQNRGVQKETEVQRMVREVQDQSRLRDDTGDRTLKTSGDDSASGKGARKEGAQLLKGRVLKTGVPLKGAKLLGSIDPKKAAERREAQKSLEKSLKAQKKVEDAKQIAQDEAAEKNEDKAQLDQTRHLKEEREKEGEGGTSDYSAEYGEVKKQDGVGRGDGSGEGSNNTTSETLEGSAAKAQSAGASASGRLAGSATSGADIANQQIAKDILNAKQRQLEDIEKQRAKALEDGIDLGVSHGFSAQLHAEIHKDIRDIRALLVMADAFQRLQEHIEGDVLAANVAAERAASFSETNVEAVQVASKRFKDQVGDVLPWQRFGAL